MKKILITFLIFAFSINTTNAWLWLIAQSWDILSSSKWNELVADKLSRINLKSWTWIVLTNSWDDIFINATSSVIPYISTTGQILATTSTQISFNLEWVNFTPSSTIIIPGFDWTIDSINVVSPLKIEITITPWSTEAEYDLVISNWWVLNTEWTWNWVGLLSVTDPVLGTWVAWTYLEDFEAWMWSWVSSWLTWDWTRDSDWTPSSNTWPDDWAWASTWYIYTEVSNWDDANEFGIETDDFRHATTVSLDYHMYWSDMWTVYIQTLYDWNWTTVWSISWEQQTAETDAYINTWDIDLTAYKVEKIRILMNWASWYRWDAAVDNISITSD